MCMIDETWLRRGFGYGRSVVSDQTRGLSHICGGHVSGHPTVPKRFNSAGQEPVSRMSAFTTFVEPCLLPRCLWASHVPCPSDHSKNLPSKHGWSPQVSGLSCGGCC